MSEKEKIDMTNSPEEEKKENYSLSDDRRVKVLSPGAMVTKRFLRNRVAIFGLIVLIAMFAFSFLGGLVSPYREDQQFTTQKIVKEEFGGARKKNGSNRYSFLETDNFKGSMQSKVLGVIQKMEAEEAKLGDDFEKELEEHEEEAEKPNAPVKPGSKKGNTEQITAFEGTFEKGGKTYTVVRAGKSFYEIKDDEGNRLSFANVYEVCPYTEDFDTDADPELKFEVLRAFGNNESSFEYGGNEYTVVYLADGEPVDPESEDFEATEAAVQFGEEDIAFISDLKVTIKFSDKKVSREFFEGAQDAVKNDKGQFELTDGEGNVTEEFIFSYDAPRDYYSIVREKYDRVLDRNAPPSVSHWLGTDEHGMDVITRLMYGGRVSLIIGFIVEFIATFIGIVLGGISGYFGGWVDNLIMRVVDIFYCIPSMPIIIIIGAEMDYYQVSPFNRMIFLMLTLGILGWPGIARMVRGQILSLREQEFMTATEACGVRASRRIFKHLIPNVIPQLVVSVSMGLGSTIITEATLSFLGLGVRFPFASWGNIISAVDKIHVLQTMWWEWIPAGVLLLLTVLAFNLVGDGLRDAFDPKMKR